MLQPITIEHAAELIRRRELTPIDLIEQCFAQIDRFEERVQAWAFIDRANAREQAAQLTEELKKDAYRGPLHGIPIGIKDIIDVFDMPTGCGSKRWAQSYARHDATCVEQLRKAGAIIVGKTVTTAYASFDPPPTRNPWNLERTPGGSSSGSAAAVACGMCLAALATQTGGSITRPASFCGVYSLKPTYGQVSLNGVLPLAPSLDHVGVMANSVRDLGIVLQAIARSDAEEVPRLYKYSDVQQQVDECTRRLAAVPGFPAKAGPEMIAAFNAMREKTRSAGWTWSEAPLPATFADAPRNQYTLMAVEAAVYHADRMRRRPDDYPPKVRSLIEHGLATSAPDFASLLAHYESTRGEIDATLTEVQATFATPAITGPAPPADTTGDPAFIAPWTYTGLPTVSLPFAWSADGLPLAVQLVGPRWCEADLLSVAVALEADIAFGRRPVPL